MGYECKFGCKVGNYLALPLSASDGVNVDVKSKAPRLQGDVMVVERVVAVKEAPPGAVSVGGGGGLPHPIGVRKDEWDYRRKSGERADAGRIGS